MIMRSILLATMLLMPFLAGCGDLETATSTRLLEEASLKINELEALLQTEREAYTERYEKLSEEFTQQQQAGEAKVKELQAQVKEMGDQVRELKQYSISLQGHIVVLQKRLDTIRKVEEQAERAEDASAPEAE